MGNMNIFSVFRKKSTFSLIVLVNFLMVVSGSTINRHRISEADQLNFAAIARSPYENSFWRIRRGIDGDNRVVDRNELLYTVMDRLCMRCHELMSHIEPNTMLECRKNVFTTTAFQKCLEIFSAKQQPVRVEPTGPVPLYTDEPNSLDDSKIQNNWT